MENPFYVPPANGQPNAAAAFLSGYLEQRTPLARAFIQRKMQLEDPSARLAFLMRAQSMVAQREAGLEARKAAVRKEWNDARKAGMDERKALIQAVGSNASARISAQGGIVKSEIGAEADARKSQALTGAAAGKFEGVRTMLADGLMQAEEQSGGDPKVLQELAIQQVNKARGLIDDANLKTGETVTAKRQLQRMLDASSAFKENGAALAAAQAILGGSTGGPIGTDERRGVGLGAGGNTLLDMLKASNERMAQTDKLYSDQLAALDGAGQAQAGLPQQQPGETMADTINRLFDEQKAKFDQVKNPFFDPLFVREGGGTSRKDRRTNRALSRVGRRLGTLVDSLDSPRSVATVRHQQPPAPWDPVAQDGQAISARADEVRTSPKAKAKAKAVRGTANTASAVHGGPLMLDADGNPVAPGQLEAGSPVEGLAWTSSNPPPSWSDLIDKVVPQDSPSGYRQPTWTPADPNGMSYPEGTVDRQRVMGAAPSPDDPRMGRLAMSSVSSSAPKPWATVDRQRVMDAAPAPDDPRMGEESRAAVAAAAPPPGGDSLGKAESDGGLMGLVRAYLDRQVVRDAYVPSSTFGIRK